MRKNNYSDQVFINCPFDDRYIKLFHAIVFAILDSGFIPRCSLEVGDATEFRLRAIVTLIEQCKYGIHDLSRVTLDTRSKLPRFNMSLELGIFYGAKWFGQGVQQRKNCIVLEKYPYRYQKFISDISGIDVTPHGNSIQKIITAVRNWLAAASRRSTIPDAQKIHSRYRKFQRALGRACGDRRIDYRTMPFVELTRNMSDWLRINQEVYQPLFSKW